MNLFATVLTYTAPSANYRGESAENRAVIQKITKGRLEYPIISPEAMRNALRETLGKLGLELNRSRLGDEEQLAVEFKDYPDADRFVDDFFMGWLVAAGAKDRKSIQKELNKRGRNGDDFVFKQDSRLRMNMAVGLEPYRHNMIFTQSPKDNTPPERKQKKNADSSMLLHRETAVTSYQYPWALNLDDCRSKPDWVRTLLKAIGELNEVAGNHARSYFEMAPASILIRVTPQLVAGYDTYGFKINEERHMFPEIVDGVLDGDYPGGEFYLGGKIVKDMDDEISKRLADMGVTMNRNPQRLLAIVADEVSG